MASTRNVTPPRNRWTPVAIAVLLIAFGTAISLARVPWAHHDIVWAEDGTIFLSENLDHGFWATLFKGYAGYQQFLPRIVSGIVIATAPLSGYATAVFSASALVTGLVGAGVFWLSRDVVPWIPARVALGLVTFVIPLAEQEVIGNLADIHSYAMWLAPWLFFYRPRTWAASAAWAVAAFAVSMTEVQAVLFIPLALIPRWRRDLRTLPISLAFLAGAVWQFITVFTVQRHAHPAWLGLPSLLEGWLINTSLPLVVANPLSVKHVLSVSGLLLPILFVVPFVLAMLVALMWGSPPQRLLAVTLAISSLAIYAAGATVDGTWWFRYADVGSAPWDRAINVRYGVSSGLMLVALVPLGAAVLRTRRFGGAARTAFARIVAWSAIVGLVAVLSFASTRAISIRGWVAAPWSQAVQTAQEQCRAEPVPHRVAVPIAPFRTIRLTCGELLDG